MPESVRAGRVAILWRGDEAARRDANAKTGRFAAVFAGLAALGIDAEPVVYEDDVADAVRARLATVDGVLVWVNPIHEGRNRAGLDALLRDVAARGVWVSAHPDVILKMGTKEVLHRTRTMGWGCDTALYRTAAEMRAGLPARLAAGPRVIKRNRGNGGQGVWKVESLPASPMLRVLDATKDASEELSLDDFVDRCAGYFEDGCVIDQPFQTRLERRCGALLYGGPSLCRLRPSQGQSPGRRSGRARRSRAAALHVQRRSAIPATASLDGRRVDAAADRIAGYCATRLADDLGCRLHAWAAPGRRRRSLRAWRDQCQLGISDSRRGLGGDRPLRRGSSAVGGLNGTRNRAAGTPCR